MIAALRSKRPQKKLSSSCSLPVPMRCFLVRIPKRDDQDKDPSHRQNRIDAAIKEGSPSIFLLDASVTILRILACYHGWREDGFLRPDTYFLILEGEFISRGLTPQCRPEKGHAWPPDVRAAHYEVDILSTKDAERWLALLDSMEKIPISQRKEVYEEILRWSQDSEVRQHHPGYVEKVRRRFTKLGKTRARDPAKTEEFSSVIDAAIRLLELRV